MQAIDCEAKASFNSTKSKSAVVMPARSNAFCSRHRPHTHNRWGPHLQHAMLAILQSGLNYIFNSRLAGKQHGCSTSLMPLLLPAVTIAVFAKAGFSWLNFFKCARAGMFIFVKIKNISTYLLPVMVQFLPPFAGLQCTLHIFAGC